MIVLCVLAVRQRACVRTAPPEQAVSGTHLLRGGGGGASSHPRPHLGAAEGVPRHALPPQQRKVERRTLTRPQAEHYTQQDVG